MKFEKYDIIAMGNNKEYTISEILDYNQNKYLHLIQIDENEELLDDTLIGKVVTDGKGTFGVTEIKDEKELLEINEIFIGMIKDDYL